MATIETMRGVTSQGVGTSALAIAERTVKKFIRTPQLIMLGTAQGVIFLLLFNYVFGGAIETADVAYVDFLVPGIVVTGVLFLGSAAAVGVSEDVELGLYDRLRSMPIPRSSILLGRVLADWALLAWSLAAIVVAGFAIGFRVQTDIVSALTALGLCLLFGFAVAWVFLAVGLAAADAETAQGLAFIVLPVSFVSSAFVPIHTLPGWLRVVADHQPVTVLVDAVRFLTVGDGPGIDISGSAGQHIALAMGWIVGTIVVFVPVATWLFRRR